MATRPDGRSRRRIGRPPADRVPPWGAGGGRGDRLRASRGRPDRRAATRSPAGGGAARGGAGPGRALSGGWGGGRSGSHRAGQPGEEPLPAGGDEAVGG